MEIIITLILSFVFFCILLGILTFRYDSEMTKIKDLNTILENKILQKNDEINRLKKEKTGTYIITHSYKEPLTIQKKYITYSNQDSDFILDKAKLDLAQEILDDKLYFSSVSFDPMTGKYSYLYQIKIIKDW